MRPRTPSVARAALVRAVVGGACYRSRRARFSGRTALSKAAASLPRSASRSPSARIRKCDAPVTTAAAGSTFRYRPPSVAVDRIADDGGRVGRRIVRSPPRPVPKPAVGVDRSRTRGRPGEPQAAAYPAGSVRGRAPESRAPRARSGATRGRRFDERPPRRRPPRDERAARGELDLASTEQNVRARTCKSYIAISIPGVGSDRTSPSAARTGSTECVELRRRSPSRGRSRPGARGLGR